MTRLLLLLTLSACASTGPALLPPLPLAWQQPGSEPQVILSRQLELEALAEPGQVAFRRFERRLHRTGGELMVRLPVHADRRVTRAGLRILTPAGRVGYRDLGQFVFTNRAGDPVLDPKNAAFLALRVRLEPGSMVDWAFEGLDRRSHWLPGLALDGPYPIVKAELSLLGPQRAQIELRARGLALTRSLSERGEHYRFQGLRPHLAHPWSPAPLGERALRPRWRQAKGPGLVARMTAKPAVVYDLAVAPAQRGNAQAKPCLLMPLASPEPSPDEVLLATASAKPEGGLEVQVDPLLARGFSRCRLVEPGAPADVLFKPQSGLALWRLRSDIKGAKIVRTQGRLQFGGLAAHAIRRGKLDPVAVLKSRFSPSIGAPILIDQAMGPSGPITLRFELRFEPQTLDPQGWLNKAYPELDWLREGSTFLGPLIDEERIQWDFVMSRGEAPLPPTQGQTLTEPELVGSATWTLGALRSVRFVQELRWQLEVHKGRPALLREALNRLRLPALSLEGSAP